MILVTFRFCRHYVAGDILILIKSVDAIKISSLTCFVANNRHQHQNNILEINEKLKDKMVSKEELESEKELRQKLVDMISGNADRLT